jgi:PAS domain S-box-containing protein
VILLQGMRLWPAIFLAALVANATTAGSIYTSLVIAGGNTLGAVVAVYAINRWSNGRSTFEAPAQVARFAWINLLVATPISATIGVTSLSLAGFAAWPDFGSIWMTWWLGDLAGALVVAPLLVLWATTDRRTVRFTKLGESVAVFTGACGVGLLAFSPLVDPTFDRGPLGFLAILPLLWAALRGGPRDTATVAFLLSCFAIWGTVSSGGPFARDTLNESFLLLITFVISTAVPSLALSADLAVRTRAETRLRVQEQDLRRAREELELRVERRTAALAAVNQALHSEVEQRKRIEAKLTRDFEERRKAQEALVESERRFRLLVDGVADHAIVMLDPQGRISNWNNGARRIKGYSANEIVGRHFSCFYSEADRHAGAPARALETAAREGKFETEGWRVRKDGSEFWASVVIDAVRDEAGELVGFAKITRNMTERREAHATLERTREELHQAQKMEALGHLIGGIAHDFNNFLTGVIGNVELVRATTSDTGQHRRLDAALQAAQNGAALIRQMLIFARKQPIEAQAVDVNSVVQEISMLIRRSCPENVEIRTDLAVGLASAKADPNQLQASILNLVVNAYDAMPSGGQLTIATSVRRLSSRQAASHAGDDYVCLSVTDTGTGMTPEILEHAFEPFFTTKDVGKGTGLGLSMVYGATRKMGGDVTIESEPGRGTTVQILLPTSPVAPQAVDAPGTSPARGDVSRADPVSLLYVEDDFLVATSTAEIFESAGFRVHQAANAERALAILDAHPELGLVVTDVGLPGMNGHDMVARARKQRPDLKAVFVTGYDRARMIGQVSTDAMTDYIDKPYNPPDLVHRIRRLLGYELPKDAA